VVPPLCPIGGAPTRAPPPPPPPRGVHNNPVVVWAPCPPEFFFSPLPKLVFFFFVFLTIFLCWVVFFFPGPLLAKNLWGGRPPTPLPKKDKGGMRPWVGGPFPTGVFRKPPGGPPPSQSPRNLSGDAKRQNEKKRENGKNFVKADSPPRPRPVGGPQSPPRGV